jgi:glutamate:GABA antiporter
MEVRQRTDGIEKQYVPTALQKTIGEPLRSEQRTGEILPRVLTQGNLLVICITVILFVSNVSVVQPLSGKGLTVYFYWMLGALTFLVPGAIVCGQLNRLMPSNGGIYVWTHRALGPLWGFFAGFCAWFPGILVLLSAADGVVAFLEGIITEIGGTNTGWLADPRLQGIVAIGMLLLGGWLATLPIKPILRLATVVIVLYCVAFLIVGLAGGVWLFSGHPSQLPFKPLNLGSEPPNFALYGIIVLALLGIEVPLNMSAERRQARAPARYLFWGPLIALLAYVIGTFGVKTVVPPAFASEQFSTLIAVSTVFGRPAAVVIGVIFVAFFMIVAVIYNIAFARILFVSGLDHRLPGGLARVNRHRAPSRAILVQTIIVLAIAIYIYFLGPLLFYWANSETFTFQVYDITQATTTVIWCISMVMLFLDLPVLLRRFRKLFAANPGQLIARPWFLYLCCAFGGAASLLGIWAVFSSSWDTKLISNSNWILYVGASTLVCLIIGLLSSAYPRLLSSLNEQTAQARENARLYSELSAAYAKLSELDQLKDAFISTASHELRTPLTIVRGYLELLDEMENLDIRTRRDFIHKARRACDELVLLQANIMDASRLRTDTEALHYTNIQLASVCAAMIDLFEPLILQEQREVEVHVSSSMTIWADETCLKQILHNLLANALRYSPRGTPVRLTAEVVEDRELIRISVIDHGLGVPPDKHDAIFERFVRLERDMHGTVRGSGLGLAISRQLVEAMGGTMNVESPGIPGEGSTFTFTLPAAHAL